jgi:hypothetical protein
LQRILNNAYLSAAHKYTKSACLIVGCKTHRSWLSIEHTIDGNIECNGWRCNPNSKH